MKKSILVMAGFFALAAPLASQAQALDIFSNPPPRVFMDPQPSAADPSYPGEEVLAPRHGFGSHHGTVVRDETGFVQPGYMPRYNAGTFDVQDDIYGRH